MVKTYSKSRWTTLRNNKELFIGLLKMHYYHTKEEFYEYCSKNNIEFKKIDMPTTQMIRMREFHNVKPQDVGLKKWPTKTELVQDLRTEEDTEIIAVENLQGDGYE